MTRGLLPKCRSLHWKAKPKSSAMKGLCLAQSQFACAAGTAYMVKLRRGPITLGLRNRAPKAVMRLHMT